MKALFSFLLLLLPLYLLLSQNVSCYMYKLGKAQFHLSQQQYVKSQEWFLAAEKEEVNHRSYFYLTGGKIYAALSDSLKAFSYLEQALIHGLTWETMERNMQAYPSFINSLKWQTLAQQYPIYRQQYTSKLDIDTYTLLVKMGSDDQAIRRYRHYNQTDTLVYKYMGEIDSINLTKLKALIQKSGFPTLEQVGLEGYRTLYLVLLHGLTNETWAWSFFESVLLEAVQTGKLIPPHYAHIIDRRLLWGLKKPQYYGSFNWKDGKLTGFNEITDVATVDERRLDIGLSSLADFAQNTGWVLPKAYVKKDVKYNCD